MFYRTNKNSGYTIIDNCVFNDTRLSLKAKGLMCQMLSLPDNWQFSINGLASICNESKSAISKTFKELENCGYAKKMKLSPNQTKSGRIEYNYNIYESPNEKTSVKKQGVENKGLVSSTLFQEPCKQDLENSSTYKIINNKELKQNTNKNELHNIYGSFQNVKLTDDEYNKLKEQGLTDYIENLSKYIASTGKKYDSHYATILSWAGRDRDRNKKQKSGKNLKCEPSFDIEEIKRRIKFNDDYDI